MKIEHFHKALKDELNKLGTVITQPLKASNDKQAIQLNVSHAGLNTGPTAEISSEKIEWSRLSNFAVALAKEIHEKTKGNCSFMQLASPLTTVTSVIYVSDNIIIRYLKDFLPGTDDIAERYDVLIIPA